MLVSAKSHWLWPYGLAVLLTGIATALAMLLAELTSSVIFAPFYVAVAVVTWQGGLRAALLTIVLSALMSLYFLLPPAFSFNVSLEGLIRIVAFVLIALLINSMVAARKQAEDALAEREKQLRSIIDATPALISYIGADLRYRFNNRTYESWFGFSQAEIPGQHVREILGEAAYQALRPYFEAVLAGQHVSYERLAPYGTGGPRYVQATYTPDFDEHGQVRGFVVLVNDISQRKQAEESLEVARAEAEQVRERLERILGGIKDDFVMYDSDWRYVYVNDAAAQTLGYPKEKLLGQRIWDLFPGAVDNFFYQKVHQAVAEKREITFDYYYPPFGKWFENRAYPIIDGLLLFSSDVTERKQAEERLWRLQEVTWSFAGAQTLQEVRRVILDEVVKAIGANAGGLRLVVGEELVLEETIFGVPIDPEVTRRFTHLPLQVQHPATDTARSGEALFIRDAEDHIQRYPNLAEIVVLHKSQATISLPLRRGEEVFGVLSLTFAEPHLWDEAERSFALALADRAAVSYERARLFEAERRTRAEAETAGERLRLLAEASEVLIASTSYETALSDLAHLIVPRLADWCVVDLIRQDELIHRLAVVHRDPAKAEAAAQLQRHYPAIDLQKEHTITKMLRRGQSWFDPEVSEIRLAAEARDEAHLQLLRDLGFASEMVVLLTARGRTLGALTLVRASRERPYEPEDLALAEELARRATIAVDNARLYEAEQQARRTAEETAERISTLQGVTAALSQALTPAQVAEVIVQASTSLLNTSVGAVHFLSRDGNSLELAYAKGYSEELMAYARLIPLSEDIPATIAVLEGRSLWIESREALISGYPRLASPRPPQYEALAAVPLLVEEQWQGVLTLSFFEIRDFSSEEQVLILTMARQCAQALERARLYQEMQQLNTELEKRVAQRTAELERSLKELDQFTYIASHDLKAPLRGVKQLSAWIVEDAGNLLPESSKVHLAKLQGRIERMEGLLNDLLMYSRVGRNYYSSMERVDTGALVKEVVEMLAPPPTFTVTVQEGLPILTTSRTPLELIFKNLIENGIKHHHRAEGRIEISARELDDLVEFSVKDDGPGIDERFHERIFQIFQTLQPRDGAESTGVGLSIVKKAVESQGGSLSLISAEAEGSTFRFTWPKH